MEHHFFNSGTQRPVCWDTVHQTAVQGSQDIEKVDCVLCLRRLVKSAGQYGHNRRVDRSTTYGKGGKPR